MTAYGLIGVALLLLGLVIAPDAVPGDLEDLGWCAMGAGAVMLGTAAYLD